MKRAFTLLEVLIVVAIVLFLAAVLWPCINRSPENAHRSSCRSNLKQIGLGFIQYAQDYDDRFPSARITSTMGWKDVISRYIKSDQVFQCPSVPNSDASLTDYFYNRHLVRFHQEKLDDPSLTVLSGDGSDDAPAWNSIMQLPIGWSATEKSPARRHLDMANYLFADGHVKSQKPSAIKTTSPSQESSATFAVK